MATTQAQRAALYNDLTEAMNEEAADTLMDQLPPGGWDQMATKTDLANTEQRLQTALEMSKTDLANTEQRLQTALEMSKTDLANTEHRLQVSIAETNAKLAETNAAMQAGFAELRALIATGLADAAKERAEIIRSQARQLYFIVAAISVATISVWVAVLTSVIVS